MEVVSVSLLCVLIVIEIFKFAKNIKKSSCMVEK